MKIFKKILVVVVVSAIIFAIGYFVFYFEGGNSKNLIDLITQYNNQLEDMDIGDTYVDNPFEKN